MPIKLKKINDVEVKKIPVENMDTRPVRGCKVCKTKCSNVAFIAPTASGKTTAMFEMLRQCAGKKTKVILFVSTVYNDESWHTVKKWLKKKRIEFEEHTSIYEGKKDLLQEYVDKLTKEAEEREKVNNTPIDPIESCLFFDKTESDEDEEEDKKYQYPSYIFIFDDVSSELGAPSFGTLLKKARHLDIMIMTSSQDLKDLKGSGLRTQIRIWLLFKGLNEERLKTAYEAISSKLDFNLFKKMYQFATQKPFSFFYVSVRDNDHRINFCDQFQI